MNAQETYNDQLKNVEIICLSITPSEKRIVVVLLFCSYRIITFFNVNPNNQIGIMTFITSCCISRSQLNRYIYMYRRKISTVELQITAAATINFECF